jgi:hypothetical protein
MKERINAYMFITSLLFKNHLCELSESVRREYELQLVVQTEPHLKNENLCEKFSNKFLRKVKIFPRVEYMDFNTENIWEFLFLL